MSSHGHHGGACVDKAEGRIFPPHEHVVFIGRWATRRVGSGKSRGRFDARGTIQYTSSGG